MDRLTSLRLPLDKAPDQIAGMFDAIAARYDLLNHVLSLGFDRQWRTRAVRSLRLTGSEMVLDMCTGTGDLAAAVTRGRSGAAQVIGIDFATEMLRKGQAKLRQQGLTRRVRFVRGDATEVPLSDGSVDAATIAFGIRNVAEPSQALDELRRVVRPGGRIAILEFGSPQAPVLRSLYGWYFQRILPWVGRVVSGHQSAYTYLPASVSAFREGVDFCDLLRQAHFTDIRIVRLQFGVVYLYEARRS